LSYASQSLDNGKPKSHQSFGQEEDNGEYSSLHVAAFLALAFFVFFFFGPQRISAAFRALACRSSGDSFPKPLDTLALPPRRPKATAAGFLVPHRKV
jgi:hypothetical protein